MGRRDARAYNFIRSPKPAARGMTLTCIKRIASFLLTAVALSAAAQQATDADVLAARDAVQHGQWKVLEQLRPRFAGHLLEAYPTYWLLAGNLERADPAQVEAFFARYPSGPLAESLRREWLKVLGAAGAWDLFREQYPRLLADDAEITCYSFQERLARDDPEVGGEAHALFVAARETPSACDPVFAALVADGRVSEGETWTRMRQLLALGLVRDAKRTNALLPARVRIDDRKLEHVASDPVRFLAHEKGALHSRAERELAIFAVERLARNHSDDAADRLALLAPRLGADAKFAWSQVAWQGALNHEPLALDWYARAGDAPLSDAQLAWKARAALRAGDWKSVLAAIDAFAPEQAREATWRYWRARALRALGERAASDALLRSLAGQPTFYGLLAADTLGVRAAPEWKGYQPDAADLERVRDLDGVRRALLLYRLGLNNDGLREWTWAVRNLDDRGLLAAAQIAREANVPDRAIWSAERTVQLHDFGLRYPTPHRDALDAAARQWDLDEAFVYGIIRQESRFMPDVRSPVGAVGLMQLMPSTARWVARQISLRPFKADMLTRPELNVEMGAYYLRRVLTSLGDPVLAAAAYNAGPGRARRWRDAKPLEAAIYTETIPFNETREYVKKVFTNAWYYRHRLTGSAPGFAHFLGTVPGSSADDAAVVANIP